MKFFNSLYMSVLLVLGFLCLNSYEAKVHKELDAHNYVLNQIVDGQSINLLSLLQYCKGSSEKTDSELMKIKKLDSDLENIKNLKAQLLLDTALNKITSLFTKYNIEEKLVLEGKFVSYLSLKHFYDNIEDRVKILMDNIILREKFNQRNNVDVIIIEREESYAVDKSYELDFVVVSKGNEILKEAIGSYKIGDDEFPLQYFPIELSSKPDSITFYLNGGNKVTGEKYNIKEKHNLELKPIP